MDEQSQTPVEPITPTDVGTEPTQIPVTTPDETPVVEQGAPEPTDPQTSVPGSVETTPTAESLNQVVQEDAGNPVPATAEPSNDAVTVNSNWAKVTTDLGAIVNFINNVLATHPLAESIVSDVESIVEKVTSSL